MNQPNTPPYQTTRHRSIDGSKPRFLPDHRYDISHPLHGSSRASSHRTQAFAPNSPMSVPVPVPAPIPVDISNCQIWTFYQSPFHHSSPVIGSKTTTFGILQILQRLAQRNDPDMFILGGIYRRKTNGQLDLNFGWGGKIKKGEKPVSSLMREIREEACMVLRRPKSRQYDPVLKKKFSVFDKETQRRINHFAFSMKATNLTGKISRNATHDISSAPDTKNKSAAVIYGTADDMRTLFASMNKFAKSEEKIVALAAIHVNDTIPTVRSADHNIRQRYTPIHHKDL